MNETQVPPGYKRTEVGVIPEDWEVRKIGDLFEILTGKSKSKLISSGGRYFIVDMGAISRDGQLIASKRTDHASDILRIGDLAMPKDDIGGGNIIGKVAFIDEDDRYVLGDHVYLLRAAGLNSKFMSYAINSATINSSLRTKASGSAQLGLARTDVAAQVLPVPSLPEQRAIAEVLSDADAWIAAMDRLIAKKRALKQAAMDELLTGRTRLPGFEKKRGTKRTEVGLIPEDWALGLLADMGDFRSGSGFPVEFQGHQTGDYPFFKVSDMNNEGNETFLKKANNWISEDIRMKIGAMKIPRESIVFAKIGAAIHLERKRMLYRDSCIDNNMMAYSINVDDVDRRFMYFAFLMIELGKLVSTTALPSLAARDIGSILIPLPPLPEQRAIAQVLSDMDTEIEALERQRAKAQAVKQGMMQELLTGRIRLV